MPAEIDNSVVLAEQTSQSYAALTNALIATAVNASALVIVQWSVVDHGVLLTWLAIIVVISVARGITALRFKRAAPPPDQARLWYRRFLAGSLLASLTWGASAIWLFPAHDLPRQVFLAFVLGGMAAGAVTTLSYTRLPIHFFLGVTLVPLLVRFLDSQTELGAAMGAMLMLYLVMMFLAADRTHTNLKQNICLRIEGIERERSLQQSEHRYETLLKNESDAFFLHDLQGRFLDVNEQACRSLGYTRDELLQMSVGDIELQADLRIFKQKWANLEQGSNIRLEGRHRRKDGTKFPVEISLGSVQTKNDKQVSVLARDISERKQAEEQLRRSLQEKELLLQEIHHRVKNNMQVVAGLLQLQAPKIRDRADPVTLAAFEESRDRIYAMAMVHDQLYRSKDLAHVDVGGYAMELASELFDAYKVDASRVQLALKGDRALVGISQAVPCGLILSELLSNCLKHAFPGDRTGHIEVGFAPCDDGHLEMSIADNGVGLPAGLDLTNATTLGLSLVNGLVGQLGGELGVSHNPGTRFTIRFPAA